MKQYIDGIKNNEMSLTYFGQIFNGSMISFGRLQRSIRPVKHIPILVPITTDDIHYLIESNKDVTNLKWLDGQPYEIVILKGKN